QLTLKSPAKLNLYLKILSKRSDGFHNIETVLEKIDLCDKITLTGTKDGRISVVCRQPAVPTGRLNLAFQAAELLKKDFQVKQGVKITLIKKIPAACGLGGGSSNAAAVLLGLNRLWHLGLSKKQLLNYAKKLGCDVPFFLSDASFALAKGRGDEVRPLPNIKRKFWHLLVVSGVKIPTRSAYCLWDKNRNLELTRKKTDVRIQLLALRQNSLLFFAKGLYNSFTAISQRLCPDISRIMQRLEKMGIQAVSMSGKGPAVFGIVSSRKEAIEYKRQLEGKGWSVFAVKTF
ncbi:MAG: 4-(cytidine 5'-diphospho)-2-C-methyl-D-erythritol kinase, partial [Candidatus Omnitrophica bacterium]|nr:4-(cytidine 5'-diphospho)-2-C-methyl-D-erythritol kinase [Candidatus Omnitrophota bacterium]